MENANWNDNEISPQPCQNGFSKKNTHNKCEQACGERALILCWHLCWECKLVQPLWKTLEISQKTENGTPICPSSSTPRYISKQEKALIKKHAAQCSLVLFTIARIWKQPKCPSTGEWIKKVWYRCTMEYYSAIKRMKLFHLQYGLTWRILS